MLQESHGEIALGKSLIAMPAHMPNMATTSVMSDETAARDATMPRRPMGDLGSNGVLEVFAFGSLIVGCEVF
jgi:hypothetical protein